MGIIIGLTCALLLAITCSSPAFALSVSPSSVSVEAFTNQDALVWVNVTNNKEYEVFHVNFTRLNDVSFTGISNLSAGQSVSVPVKVRTTAAYSSSVVSNVWCERRSTVDVDPVTYNVTITAGGFVPSVVSLIQGSTVVFRNNDTLTHSVTGSSEDHELSVGASWSKVFDSSGEQVFFDRFSNLQFRANVTSRSSVEFVHDTADDAQLTLAINSVLVETNISMGIVTNDLSAQSNAQKNGVLRVKNDGTVSLRNVRPTAERWVTFTDSGFNLNAGEERFVVFYLTPSISNVSETGKNYSVNFVVSANNALSKNDTLRFVVPLEVVINQNATAAADFFKEKLAFCTQFPTSPLCMTEPVVKEVTKVVYETPPLPYNYSQDDVHRLNRNYLELNDKFDRLSNTMREDSVVIKDKLVVVENVTLGVNNTMTEYSEAFDTWSYGLLGLVVLALLGGGGFVLGRYWLRQKSDEEAIQT